VLSSQLHISTSFNPSSSGHYTAPGRSEALKALRRSDREFDQRLMREVLRSLEHKPDAKTGGRNATIKHG
jgi:hypothetical protein